MSAFCQSSEMNVTFTCHDITCCWGIRNFTCMKCSSVSVETIIVEFLTHRCRNKMHYAIINFAIEFISFSLMDNSPHIHVILQSNFDTSMARQNGRHFPDVIFKSIFVNENISILIEISKCYSQGASQHYLNQSWLVYRRMFASLSLIELMLYLCSKEYEQHS